jgi:putative thioredoxin
MMSVPFSGAVDLAALAAAKQAQAAVPAGTNAAVALTEANANDVIQKSAIRPVFVLLCSPRAPQCAELQARVAALLAPYGDAVVLATVDVETEPGIAQAFQVQAVPAMVALLGGRPAPLFQGSPDDAQLTEVVGQVLDVARQAGMQVPHPDGSAPAPAEQTEPELPPLHQEARDAIEREDFDAAIAAYDQALKENPKDADARAGRAQVGLIARTRTADLAAVRHAAADDPANVEAQMAVADMDVLGGQIEDAFARLLDVMATLPADQREPVRQRLVELFEVVGPTDARVVAARQRLANALH